MIASARVTWSRCTEDAFDFYLKMTERLKTLSQCWWAWTWIWTRLLNQREMRSQGTSWCRKGWEMMMKKISKAFDRNIFKKISKQSNNFLILTKKRENSLFNLNKSRTHKNFNNHLILFLLPNQRVKFHLFIPSFIFYPQNQLYSFPYFSIMHENTSWSFCRCSYKFFDFIYWMNWLRANRLSARDPLGSPSY